MRFSLEDKAAAEGLILAERRRQVTAEGYGAEHDAAYLEGELIRAGIVYLLAKPSDLLAPLSWPWAAEHYKPRDRRANLIRAGALFLADQDKRRAAGIPPGSAVEGLLAMATEELAVELGKVDR